MISFFCQRGYCAASLQRDLDAIQWVNRNDVIKHRDPESRNLSRIPLVLTFHPLSERIKRILLSNFNILSGDPQTKEIFPQPPLVAYRRDRNVRDTLVHTADRSQPGPHLGTSPCTHNRCRTCDYISRDSTLQGPQCAITIKDAFTCQSSGLVYAISCRRSGLLENASASISAALRKACRDFLPRSILIQMDMPCRTYKSEGSCSAMETKTANARKCA